MEEDVKKFSFSLQNVRTFKGQVLDNLQNELAVMVQQTLKQEEIVNSLKLKLEELKADYKERRRQGMSVLDLNLYEAYIDKMYREIELESLILNDKRRAEDGMRVQVIEANKEVLSIDKFKEKKLDEYNKAVQKSEEIFIEEFVANSLTRKM